MKLFFASDIHGSLPSTETILRLYRESGSNQLILLGDILNHGPRNTIPQGYNPAEVAEQLNEYAADIIAVRGNCDSEVDQMLLAFPMMSTFSQVLLESGQKLFLTHGHLYNGEKAPQLNKNDVLIHGHTHIPLAESLGEAFIFNPGSVTFPKGGYEPSYGLYEDGVLSVLNLDGNVIKTVSISA